MDSIHKVSIILLISLCLRGSLASGLLRFEPHGRRLQATNCVFPDDGSDCQKCASLFYLDPAGSPNCLPISDTDCAVSGGFNDVCQQCKANYYFEGKASRCKPQNLAGCLTYQVNKNYCLTCSAGLILTAGTCAADNSANCAVYTARTNRCSVCNSGYLFLNGGCRSRFDPNCSYSQIFGPLCTSCNPTYFPNSSSRLCEKREDPNCGTYVTDSADCQTCNNLYFLRATRCLPISAFYTCSVSVENTDVCGTCITGYIPDGNGGCQKN